MTGAPDEKAEKHIESGLKNGAHYFVEDIMPKVMDYLQNKLMDLKYFGGGWQKKVMLRK